jgi:alanyl-tRNA synthetase
MTPEIFRNEFQYNKFRNEKCEWCGNSREQIRWGKIVECPNRPKLANKYNNMGVADIISDEESTYFKLLNEAETKLPQIVKKLGGIIDAKMLVKLQTTYGYEPDIVSTIMDIEIEKLMPEYETEMDVHRSKSRNKKFQK